MIKSNEGRVEMQGTKPELFADACVLLRGFYERKIFTKDEIRQMASISCLKSDVFDTIDKLISLLEDEENV